MLPHDRSPLESVLEALLVFVVIVLALYLVWRAAVDIIGLLG